MIVIPVWGHVAPVLLGALVLRPVLQRGKRLNLHCSQICNRLSIINPGLEIIKLLHTQLFIMLVYVKMPTIVGILTFKSMINTLFESLKTRKAYFSAFFERLNFQAQMS